MYYAHNRPFDSDETLVDMLLDSSGDATACETCEQITTECECVLWCTFDDVLTLQEMAAILFGSAGEASD